MVVWSLFDGSGIMGLPWAEAGHEVYCFNADTANHGEYIVKMHNPNLNYVNQWIDADFAIKRALLGTPEPNIIFGFPDCTMFAQSGAKHERGDEEIAYALANAKLIKRLGDQYCCPWMVENPVGKLSTKWRLPDAYFDPWQYGGYLSEVEGAYHPRMPTRDRYTKKTCIWHGNGFVMPEHNPTPDGHIGFFWGWKYLGGSSAMTKQLRSLTPRGFARAVYHANKFRLHHEEDSKSG